MKPLEDELDEPPPPPPPELDELLPPPPPLELEELPPPPWLELEEELLLDGLELLELLEDGGLEGDEELDEAGAELDDAGGSGAGCTSGPDTVSPVVHPPRNPTPARALMPESTFKNSRRSSRSRLSSLRRELFGISTSEAVELQGRYQGRRRGRRFPRSARGRSFCVRVLRARQPFAGRTTTP